MLNTIEVSKVHSLEFSECSDNSQNHFWRKSLKKNSVPRNTVKDAQDKKNKNSFTVVVEMTTLKDVKNTALQPTS